MDHKPIFKTNPRIHVHDPFPIDIRDNFRDFNDRHNILAQHIPFHNNGITPFHVHDPIPIDIKDHFRDFNDRHNILAPHIPFHNNGITPFGGSRVDWDETPEAHELRVELPGLKREEVKVKVKEGKFLKISGRKQVEREETHENWHHFERSKGKFLRVLSLPENSRTDQVRSCFEGGILTVTVPKRDVQKSHAVKNIEVKG